MLGRHKRCGCKPQTRCPVLHYRTVVNLADILSRDSASKISAHNLKPPIQSSDLRYYTRVQQKRTHTQTHTEDSHNSSRHKNLNSVTVCPCHHRRNAKKKYYRRSPVNDMSATYVRQTYWAEDTRIHFGLHLEGHTYPYTPDSTGRNVILSVPSSLTLFPCVMLREALASCTIAIKYCEYSSPLCQRAWVHVAHD